jgi:very-short-patch-repair endonuclease
MGKVLGFKYYNNRVKIEINKYCYLNGLNPKEIISNNKNKPKFCLYCGNLLDKNNKKFCNSSCAASFNNKNRKHTEETKLKIKNTLLNKFEKNSLSKSRKCVVCGKEFIVKKNNNRYSQSTTCSKECSSHLRSIKSKLNAQKLIDEGRHIGWQSRNIISYPEKFWMSVLDNNGINYKHNFYVREYHYFLDFLIEINGVKIDLEIDGKQHKYSDRMIHDEIRDINVKKSGFIVYRVEWNNINNDSGKNLMKDKIKNFLDFINNINKQVNDNQLVL